MRFFRGKSEPSITEVPPRDEDREADPPGDVEDPGNVPRTREEEAEKTGDDIRELEQRLKDLASKNSSLEKDLEGLRRENSTLNKKYREAHGQLEEAEAAVAKYHSMHEESSKLCDNLYSQCKDLRASNDGIARTNRDQEEVIKTLKESKLKLNRKLDKQVAQLNKFTGDIARRNQRVNTSAIRDDEYFGKEFAGLAKDIRSWSFLHFFPHSEGFVPRTVARGLWSAIGEIAGGSDLPGVFKNHATGRRVVAGLVANQMRKEIFDPLLLGLLPTEFTEFENMVEKTGLQKSQWLSQTISLSVKNEKFKQSLNEKVLVLSRDLGEILGRLASQESDESKRNKKLCAIVERAAHLATEVSQQPYWFRFTNIRPGDQFNSHYTHDVEGEVSLEEDDPGTSGDCWRVSLSVFPLVYRQEDVKGGKGIKILINRAWVTTERGNSQTVVEQRDGDITNKEAKGGEERGGGYPGGGSQGGGELPPEGEGSENSPHSSISATEKATPPESISPGLKEDAGLVALTREEVEEVSIS